MIERSEHGNREREELSRLPEDAAYWDRLARGVEERSAPLIAEYELRSGGWLGWVGDRSPALAAGALIAAALAWLFLPPSVSVSSSTAPLIEASVAQPSTVARALTPTDPLVARIMTDVMPPTIGSLLTDAAPEGRP